MRLKRPYAFRKFSNLLFVQVFFNQLPLPPFTVSQAVLGFDQDITLFNGWSGIQVKLSADPDYLSPSNVTQTGIREITVDLPFDGSGVNYDLQILNQDPTQISWHGRTLTDTPLTVVPFPIYHNFNNGGAKP